MGMQQTIDFDRGEQLAILNRQFPKRLPDKVVLQDGKAEIRLSRMSILAVLRAIDDIIPPPKIRKDGEVVVGCCYAQLDTIAENAGLKSERHARRCIKWLEQHCLIMNQRRGARKTNRIRIIWSALAEFESNSGFGTRNAESTGRTDVENVSTTDAVTGHTDTVTGHTDTVIGHTDTVIGHTDTVIGHSVRQNVTEPKKKTQIKTPTDPEFGFGDRKIDWWRLVYGQLSSSVRSRRIDAADRLFLQRVAWLVVDGSVSEGDFYDLLEAIEVNKPTNAFKYIFSGMATRMSMDTRRFSFHLRSVRIPECEKGLAK